MLSLAICATSQATSVNRNTKGNQKNISKTKIQKYIKKHKEKNVVYKKICSLHFDEIVLSDFGEIK